MGKQLKAVIKSVDPKQGVCVIETEDRNQHRVSVSDNGEIYKVPIYEGMTVLTTWDGSTLVGLTEG